MAVSQLNKVYASVIMVDVGEGDCYVVDLPLDPKTQKNSSSWNRFVIDTGTKLVDKGPRSAGFNRMAAIKSAAFGDPFSIKPAPLWAQDQSGETGSQDLSRIPPIAGIIITHTDRDHWGNSQGLLAAAEGGNGEQKIKFTQPTVIYTPPMIEWAKILKTSIVHGGIGYIFQFSWYTRARLSIKHFEKSRDLNRSFITLQDLAEQTGYELVYRFNIIAQSLKAEIEKDAKSNFAAVAPAFITSDRCLTKRQEFDNCQVFALNKRMVELMKPHADSDRYFWIVLAEVALSPPDRWKRAGTWKNFDREITGYWARDWVYVDRWTRAQSSRENKHAKPFPFHPSRQNATKSFETASLMRSTPISRANYSLLDQDDDLVSENEDDLEIEPEPQPKVEKPANEKRVFFRIIRPSSSFKPVYEVVGLTDDVKQPVFISEGTGSYDHSYYGSAGSVFTRDFQHMAMQYLLGDTKNVPGKSNATQTDVDGEDEVDIPPEDAADQTPWVKPRNWGEWANRCSVINHWIYREVLPPRGHSNVDFAEEAPGYVEYGPEEFSMLFTGDAFELGQGETAYGPQNKIFKPQKPQFTVQHDGIYLSGQSGTTKNLTGFTANPDGNLLTWLYRQRRLTSYRLDVLKVPHHGSGTTTNAYFYRFVTASVYLFSASSNHHGHPSPETMDTILGAILQEDGEAEPPSLFNNFQNKLGTGKSILQRKQPRLFFFTHEVHRDPAKPAPEKKQPKGQMEEEKDYSGIDEIISSQRPGLMYRDRTVLGDLNSFVGSGEDRGDERFTTFFRGRERMKDLHSFLMSHETMHDEKKLIGRVPRVNARFFFQKSEHAVTRLNIGRDKHQRLRVEWEANEWEEIRPEWQMASCDTENDPVAYGKPFVEEDWNEPPMHRDDESA